MTIAWVDRFCCRQLLLHAADFIAPAYRGLAFMPLVRVAGFMHQTANHTDNVSFSDGMRRIEAFAESLRVDVNA